MEFLLIIIVLVVVAALIWFFGSKSLDRPVTSWTDEELTRRLQKYLHLLSVEMQAGAWDKTNATKATVDGIKKEINSRSAFIASAHITAMNNASNGSAEKSITQALIAAADAGNSELQTRVGEAYLNGTYGLAQSFELAKHYLAGAADKSPEAALILARMYLDGNGIYKDLAIAQLYAGKASRAGHPDAKLLLREIDLKRNPDANYF